MKYHIMCPLCGAKVFPKCLSVHKDKWVWSCPQCPFVGFEYYNAQDTEILNRYLENQDDLETDEAMEVTNE